MRPPAIFIPFALLLTGCPVPERADCFGIHAYSPLEVHLVDAAASPSIYAPPSSLFISGLTDPDLPSCGAFDGVEVGAVTTIIHTDLISRPTSVDCSLLRSDAVLPDAQTILGIRTSGRFEDYLWQSPTAYSSVRAHSVVVSGCVGDWVMDFEIGPLIETNGVDVQKVWTEDQLFDMGIPGGQAPVLIARSFQPAEGSSCAALPQPTSRCQDVFLGYFAPKTP